MKRIYLILLCVCLSVAGLTAQGTINVPANLNPISASAPATNLGDFIDANSAGNTTFVLERGGSYYFSSRKEWDFDVNIVSAPAADGDAGRPTVFRFNAGGGNLAPIYRGTGSLTWDGVYIILGEEGPTATAYENASIDAMGENKRYEWRNCIVEKGRGAMARVQGTMNTSVVENCQVRNLGDYQRFQGNGRIIDVRQAMSDSVIIRNNVIHNVLDRLYIGFRQTSTNYVEISSNTVFNHVGRHGLIQLGNTRDAKITNNLFSNPKMMGTTPSLSDEQLGPELGVVTYLISADGDTEGRDMDVRNNNIFYTDDVLAYFNSADSVMQCPVLDPTMTTILGDDADEAFFTDVVTLPSVPSRAPVLQYTMEAINDRASTDLTDMMVEPIIRQGTPFDNGYLFDFSTFDACYTDGSQSLTGATDGGRVGARTICGAETVSVPRVIRYNAALNLRAFPNPTGNETALNYTLGQTGDVSIQVYDMSGKLMISRDFGQQLPGDHTMNLAQMSNLPTGIYAVHLFSTGEGRMYTRVVKN